MPRSLQHPPAGQLVNAVFVFEPALRFYRVDLSGLLTGACIILFAPDVTVGGRLLSCASLSVWMLGCVVAGCVVRST